MQKHTANRIKRLLLVSAVLLILCSVVFMGASYAWFTDTDMQINRVLVGKLNIDLLMDKQENGTYVSIDNTTGDILAEDATIFSEYNGNGVRWEPGKTEIVYLAVENKGDVPLDYYFKLNVLEDTGLSGSLEYVIIDDAMAADLASVTDWETLVALAESDTAKNAHGNVADVLEMVSAGSAEPPTIGTGFLDVGETDYFALAVHMKEDAGNDYMGDSIVFDVAVLGQQQYITSDDGGEG